MKWVRRTSRSVRRVALVAALAVAVSAAALVPGSTGLPAAAAPAAAHGKDCSSTSSAPAGLVKDAHPVILVHGWTGGPMGKTRTLLEAKMTPGWQFLLFDYHDAATRWADAPQIAGCLADYVAKVSDAHRAVGGDGRVYFVGHSMGGLAVRFASSYPGMAARVGGLVSLDTPHAGSPWGNADAGPWGRLRELTAGYWADVPADGSKARTCLAVHQGPTGMPAGCAVAPYMPETTPVAAIGGNLTIHRTVFGFLSYDVPTGGDTIVTLDSSQAYFNSAPSGKIRTGTRVHPISVPCTQDFNGIVNAAVSLGVGGLVGRLVGGIAQMQSDTAALDSVLAGSAGSAMLDVLIAANLVPNNCSHSGIVTNAAAIDTVASALRQQAAQSTTSVKVDPTKLGLCSRACQSNGKFQFTHPTWGRVTLFTLISFERNGPTNAVVVDAAGRVRWSMGGTDDDRYNYEWALANPARDKSGLIFINYNPGRYNGLYVLQPVPDGMRVVAGTYYVHQGQDLYYASLEGPAADGLYRVLKSNNDCDPTCAEGTTTSVRLKFNGRSFVPD